MIGDGFKIRINPFGMTQLNYLDKKIGNWGQVFEMMYKDLKKKL